ncbi:MAG: AsmA family protein [Micavibrio sp.]|nr:AsmA family protein [Micavibrio sp.]
MKIIFSLLTFFVVVLGVAAIVPNFMDWNKYKGEALTKFESMIGLKASIDGDISLALLPSPRLYAENVKISDPSASDKTLLALKLLDVRVSLPALISGNVEVTSINLEEPVIRLVQSAQGQYNFMTPQIESMMNKDAGSDEKSSKTSNVAVSFEAISIKDGAFIYQAPGQLTQLTTINLDIEVDDLSGPFAVNGNLAYNGQPLEVDLKTGKIDPDTMSTQLNLVAVMGAADLNFAGVVQGGDQPSVKGEVVAEIGSLEEYAPSAPFKGKASVEGVISAGAESAALKDAVINLAGTKLNGSADVKFSPMSVNGSFTAAEPLNLDLFIKKNDGNQAQGSLLEVTNALPKTLELPALGAIKLALNFPAVIYSGANFNDATVELANADKGFTLNFEAATMPGKGPLKVTSALNFAEKSSVKGGDKIIYTSPVATIRAKGQSANPSDMIKAFTGQTGLPLVSSAKTGVFNAMVKIAPNTIALEEGVINLDDDAYSITGALSPQSDSKTPLLKLAVVADFVNFDAVMGGSREGSEASGVSSKSGGEMPFDLQIDTSIHKAIFQGKTISGLKIGARMADQKLVVNRIAASDFDGQKFDVSGIVTVDMAASKPALSGKLQLGDLTWKTTQKTQAQKSGADKWSSAAIDSGWMNAANIDFEVAANSINYEGWQLNKPSIDIEMKDGVLSINELTAGIYEGAISAKAKMKPAKGTSGLDVDGQASISKVQMEPLVTSLAAGSRLLKGRGVISMDVSAAGAGQSIKGLISALDGAGTISGSDIVIEGVDVQRFVRALSEDAKPGDSALNLWKGVGTGGSTSFETLDGSYKVQKGVVNIEKLLLDGPRASIATTGQIYLVPWTLQTAHVMSVRDRDDVPSFTVNISGSLDNPTQTFAQGLLNDYLQRKIERKVNKVLDGGLGDKLDKKLGLDGALKGILGGGTAAPKQVQPDTPVIVPDQAPALAEPANDNVAPQENAVQDAQEPAVVEEPVVEESAPEPTPEEAVQNLIKGFM